MIQDTQKKSSLVTSDKKLIGSTHFVVCGGYEKFNDLKLYDGISIKINIYML